MPVWLSWRSESLSGKAFLAYLAIIVFFTVLQMVRVARSKTMPRDQRGLFLHADMQFLKSLGVLTFLISAAVTAGSAYSQFSNEFNDTNRNGGEALVLAGFMLLRRFSIGAGVSAFAYGLATMCDAILARRSTSDSVW